MSRIDLQKKLEQLLGSRNVYFQPPGNIKMQYPCIVYTLDDIKTTHADNSIYSHSMVYTITLIHKQPDSDLVTKMLTLPYCNFDRFYTADNLNHYVYTLYNN